MNSEEKPLINLSIHESSDPEMLERDAESKTGSKPNDQASSEDKPEGIEPDSDVIYDDRIAERTLNVASPNAAAIESGITEI
ncbi:MAG: hypothetical protein KME25_09040 [Symplocastrum torsivum CPER-KK1]|jgi:hypothetical protein|uniref:Uncharacterized protein n=1 Tax=Symplocastrum torsivum CPER-KK1 TaxID=450513 RepID=A0A951U974_9CYAN|nr:hypothetical protein [Symplocastrum torsivum CPER-KK1]